MALYEGRVLSGSVFGGEVAGDGRAKGQKPRGVGKALQPRPPRRETPGLPSQSLSPAPATQAAILAWTIHQATCRGDRGQGRRIFEDGELGCHDLGVLDKVVFLTSSHGLTDATEAPGVSANPSNSGHPPHFLRCGGLKGRPFRPSNLLNSA